MIAVQPPEYFPRLEYMALVQHVDHFVLGDTFPYRRGTFHDRSRLRNAQGWHWITIPLFGNPHGAPIHEVKIETGGRWREKHWRSFLYDYRTTMYFEYVQDTIKPFFGHTWEVLAACSCRSVALLADLFGLETTLHRASDLVGSPESVADVVQAIGAQTLVVPESEADVSSISGAEVRGFTYDAPTYRQNFEDFESGMTAADLVFNYGPQAPRCLAQGVVESPAEARS